MPTKRNKACLFTVLVMSVVSILSGCASYDTGSQVTGSTAPTKLKSATEPVKFVAKYDACTQRHIDSQEGRKPGGAMTLEQKQADDIACKR